MSPEAAEPSYRFAVAPRFAISAPWPGRFERNGGVEIDPATARVHPRDDWKPLEVAAWGALVDESARDREAVLPPTHLGLLQLPERLRLAWWAQAERSGDPTTSDAGFEKLFSEFVDFLRFKRLPLPGRVRLEVAVSVPGLPSTRVGAGGALDGLGFGDRALADGQLCRAPLGLVNLGDEASFVVLLELPPGVLAARLEAAGEVEVRTLSPRALVARYFAAFPQQPCLRVRLAPGEGLWLSPFGVVHDGWTHGKRDLDVVLCVGHDAGAHEGG